MFTLENIAAAHSRVKSGADFPRYIQDLKQLGVIRYETFVADGHTEYHGSNNHSLTSPAKYTPLTVAENSNIGQFSRDLKSHQAGQTGYPTFCADSARNGVEKWIVSLESMTCTYFDRKGNAMLMENIPG